MSYYFPDLIDGIDLAAEQKRLQNFQFAASQEAGPEKAAPGGVRAGSQPGQTGDSQSELESALAQGDHEIALQDAAAAGKTFEKDPGEISGERPGGFSVWRWPRC